MSTSSQELPWLRAQRLRSATPSPRSTAVTVQRSRRRVKDRCKPSRNLLVIEKQDLFPGIWNLPSPHMFFFELMGFFPTCLRILLPWKRYSFLKMHRIITGSSHSSSHPFQERSAANSRAATPEGCLGLKWAVYFAVLAGIPAGKLTWIPKMAIFKRSHLFQTIIHVSFSGCAWYHSIYTCIVVMFHYSAE